MTTLTLLPGKISGAVRAPASKSDAQRAIVAAALAEGESRLTRFSPCADSLSALRLAKQMGGAVEEAEDLLIIRGKSGKVRQRFDCGESGLLLRLFAPVAALSPGKITLSARGSLLLRPVEMVEAALKSLGVSCRSRNGFPPLHLQGPLQPGTIRVDGRRSSQHISGLLFALPLAAGDSQITVDHPASIPYLRMTLRTLRRFGLFISAAADMSRFSIPGNQRFHPASYPLEGDWSGAAFLLVAGAIAGSVSVSGLRIDSLQADRAILDILRKCGAEVHATRDIVTVKRSALHAFECDASDTPDLFPPLAVLASACQGTSRIHGSERLKIKECDRSAALQSAFSAIGGRMREIAGSLEITGTELEGGAIVTRGDHRMAMAGAIAGLASRQGVTIDQPACVAKSYPGFFRDLQTITISRPIPNKDKRRFP